jgi:photosystem II stability/assembly factor-like uncharacterized protein
VVGSFGMVAATEDGGKTWEPWLHRIANPESLNLNAIRGIGGRIYIAGERGMVFSLDAAGNRFVENATGYTGSFFGIAGNAEVLVAFGLRGTAYRSIDQGKNWAPLKLPDDATIMGGGMEPGGGVVLANSAGLLLLGDPLARQFRPVRPSASMRYTSLTALDGGALVLTGLSGVRIEKLRGDAR